VFSQYGRKFTGLIKRFFVSLLNGRLSGTNADLG
jgi:hypothetical protein